MRSEPFKHLVDNERKLVEVVERYVWNNLGGVRHAPYGYETQPKISQEVRDILGRFSVENNLTARHIRHAPDAFIVQQNPQILYLVDYKCMTVPVCDDWIIEKVSQNAGRCVKADDIGEIHTASYDNYIKLQEIGVKVAILTYIAYHDRFLLCDFIGSIEALDPYEVGDKQTERNGEPSVNFDVTQMRTLEDFLIEEHRVIPADIAPKIQAACRELKEKISVDRDSESPLVG